MKFTIDAWRDIHLHHNVPTTAPHGCGVFTAAFMVYNQPEILMLDQEYLTLKITGIEPVMTQTFNYTWKE